LRFVLDTNVIVSALLLMDSPSREALDRAFDGGKVLLSTPVLAEIHDVLSRPKFRKYISEDNARQFLASFVRKTEWVEIAEAIQACRDPSDDKFLELAVSGHATHIVSGDKDLISLSPFRGIDIVCPDAFLGELDRRE
jgi:putative PIN family toxin of toxin-antitoxin system